MQIVPSHGTIEPSPFGLGIIGTVDVAGAPGAAGVWGAAGAWLDEVTGAWLDGACSSLLVPQAALQNTSAAARGTTLCKHFM
ncbi:hypothetical protein ACT17_16265 [Mycolicibacterium conceptionense]|uniref:Uncharacterized protein n=2 Tax=Mycolicibacterium TaxID=1866885 RepID=A0ABR5FXX9_9MYCO|nr:hypothetical protein [Mycolicibacterium conceptionense]KLI09120.1 hypothetical protein AA982_06675 [Mycolicibacterium senegalense]KLO52802.1 hypothetical protein ABW05_16080 [Mycolicibacterium senegalense]KMV17471.1 hypothetical protein ACT17_16265 [Mycolicibacterium conceptionense]OBK03283.1 hypothetical protein A5639_23270 [Mycolicibacterium conceptionense]OMB86757.1 hypothetical protein A5746_26385 [Mycolicibacterium conceptionense]